jgi:hypothetical protein
MAMVTPGPLAYTWQDPNWPGMVKLARAKKHIEDLAAEADAFQNRASRSNMRPDATRVTSCSGSG